MTVDMGFNSHMRVLAATVRLVNAVTPGEAGGRPVTEPTGDALRTAVADAVREDGFTAPSRSADARALRDQAVGARRVFEALAAGHRERAADLVNGLLRDSDARPHLDVTGDGYTLHFHPLDDSYAHGWAAGVAAGLAIALGGELAHRLGVCSAPACDRVYVDLSKNAHRRFCSTRCQNRVKTAAYRRRG
ncbi:CGNR zinc finger domain-containing protein [Actinocatenispora rupis]|uniref:Zinc finger CGNR domain-containing protein n=1 Tax=Actinocatenispora rupis TaxID=519421 RepID=A0A8J3JHE5_9ACTN|nr:CGNR zinc finger domain-containing protein [Actinocatenispora rupis]GID15913.1 hypothetical protein Aru02nite_68020 [Actinocatenispora rupis]